MLDRPAVAQGHWVIEGRSTGTPSLLLILSHRKSCVLNESDSQSKGAEARPILSPLSTGIFDYAGSLENVGGEIDLLHQLIGAFLEQTPSLMVRLQSAVDQNVSNDIRHVAHALKGSVAIFASTTVYPLAAQLEAMGRDGQLNDAAKRFGVLRTEVAKLVETLTTLLRSHAA